MKCVICSEGEIREISYPTPYEVNEEEVMVVVTYSQCDHCESEYADEAQVRKNKDAMVAARAAAK